MLEVEGLRRAGFGPFELSVASRECLAVMGKSGAGKSLLLRAIADLDPNEGTVTLEGVSREAMSATEWRRRVAYVPAVSGWWDEGVGAHFPAIPDVRGLVERLGFPADVFDWEVERLSTGERQRLAFARALANEPRVLMLDEPTSALDPETTATVESIVSERLAAGVAVLFVTHGAEQAARLGARILRIEAGKSASGASG